jgi:hypothetical protein
VRGRGVSYDYFVLVLKATAVSAERKLSAQRNGALTTTPTTKMHVADEPLGVVVSVVAVPRQTLAPVKTS